MGSSSIIVTNEREGAYDCEGPRLSSGLAWNLPVHFLSLLGTLVDGELVGALLSQAHRLEQELGFQVRTLGLRVRLPSPRAPLWASLPWESSGLVT